MLLYSCVYFSCVFEGRCGDCYGFGLCIVFFDFGFGILFLRVVGWFLDFFWCFEESCVVL